MSLEKSQIITSLWGRDIDDGGSRRKRRDWLEVGGKRRDWPEAARRPHRCTAARGLTSKSHGGRTAGVLAWDLLRRGQWAAVANDASVVPAILTCLYCADMEQEELY
jgi:hypothetical protein